jgi:hypothetical protein
MNDEFLPQFSTAIKQMTPVPFLHMRATLVGGKASATA